VINIVSQSPIAILPSNTEAPENRPDCRGIGAFYEALHVGLRAMPNQDRSNDKNKEERWQKYSERRDRSAAKTCNQIPDEDCSYNHGARTDHS